MPLKHLFRSRNESSGDIDAVDMPEPNYSKHHNLLNDDEQSLSPEKDASGGGVTKQRPTSVTGRMLMLAAACSLGFFSSGYQIILLNGPGAVIEGWINVSYAFRGYNQYAALPVIDGGAGSAGAKAATPGLSPETTRLVYALTTAAPAAGAIVGAMFAAPIADRVGRRSCQLILASFALAGAIFGGIGGSAYFPELLMCARVLCGVASGATTALAPMYLSESSPLALRGSFSTSTQMFGCAGAFLCQILGLPDFLGTDRLWPKLFYLGAIPSIVQIILTLLSPESPRYLYINQREKLEAIKALKKLRSASATDSLDEELTLFENEAEIAHKTAHVTVSQLLFDRKYFWPMSVAIVMQLSLQWSGITGIVGYSSILFQRAGVAAEAVGYVNLSISIISITTAVALTILIDRAGRRALHLGGMIGMIVFGVGILVFSVLPQTYTISDASTLKFFNNASIACVLIFLTFYNMGPASIPWIIVPELFGQEARAPATSICCFINWSNSFLLFLTFPLMEQKLGVLVFLPFVTLLVVFFVFLAKYLPETKGKTSEEIGDIFERYNTERPQSRYREYSWLLRYRCIRLIPRGA